MKLSIDETVALMSAAKAPPPETRPGSLQAIETAATLHRLGFVSDDGGATAATPMGRAWLRALATQDPTRFAIVTRHAARTA